MCPVHVWYTPGDSCCKRETLQFVLLGITFDLIRFRDNSVPGLIIIIIIIIVIVIIIIIIIKPFITRGHQKKINKNNNQSKSYDS